MIGGNAMIQHYEHHAANERTYLAWIRTALAIAAFGFIVDKFSLWANAALGIEPAHAGFLFDHAGFSMLIICLVVLVGSTIRFLTTSKRIDSVENLPWRYDLSDLLLGVSLVCIALAAIVLMLHVAVD
jgi:putative membrane protein